MMGEVAGKTAINLTRALSRLEQKILISPDPRLARSSFERTKTSAVSSHSPSFLGLPVPDTMYRT